MQVRLNSQEVCEKKKKKRLMLSVAARARQGQEFSYMKGTCSQELSRETNRKSEITPRWARCGNQPKASNGEEKGKKWGEACEC